MNLRTSHCSPHRTPCSPRTMSTPPLRRGSRRRRYRLSGRTANALRWLHGRSP
jgi:hypothetical protein